MDHNQAKVTQAFLHKLTVTDHYSKSLYSNCSPNFVMANLAKGRRGAGLPPFFGKGHLHLMTSSATNLVQGLDPPLIKQASILFFTSSLYCLKAATLSSTDSLPSGTSLSLCITCNEQHTKTGTFK